MPCPGPVCLLDSGYPARQGRVLLGQDCGEKKRNRERELVVSPSLTFEPTWQNLQNVGASLRNVLLSQNGGGKGISTTLLASSAFEYVTEELTLGSAVLMPSRYQSIGRNLIGAAPSSAQSASLIRWSGPSYEPTVSELHTVRGPQCRLPPRNSKELQGAPGEGSEGRQYRGRRGVSSPAKFFV